LKLRSQFTRLIIIITLYKLKLTFSSSMQHTSASYAMSQFSENRITMY